MSAIARFAAEADARVGVGECLPLGFRAPGWSGRLNPDRMTRLFLPRSRD
jgi:hypothetical protein